MDSNRDAKATKPFAQLGWIRELLDWVQTLLDPLAMRVTGSIRQLNASPTFSLVRVETTGNALWFKATGEPNLNELPISVSLAHLFPRYVPNVLATHPTWNAWISKEVSGSVLSDHKEPGLWMQSVERFAELQLSSIGKCTELLENQCKDLRLGKIAELVDPFLSQMACLMEAQQKLVPAPLTSSDLGVLGNYLKQAFSSLQELGVPDTLGHLDPNPANVIVSGTRSVFLDWAEGCVTNPFLTFEYFREHFLRNCTEEKPAVQAFEAAYARPWKKYFSAHAVTKALVLSPLLAVFAYAVCNDTWLRPEMLLVPTVASYFRSLTRRMNREMLDLGRREEPCLV